MKKILCLFMTLFVCSIHTKAIAVFAYDPKHYAVMDYQKVQFDHCEKTCSIDTQDDLIKYLDERASGKKDEDLDAVASGIIEDLRTTHNKPEDIHRSRLPAGKILDCFFGCMEQRFGGICRFLQAKNSIDNTRALKILAHILSKVQSISQARGFGDWDYYLHGGKSEISRKDEHGYYGYKTSELSRLFEDQKIRDFLIKKLNEDKHKNNALLIRTVSNIHILLNCHMKILERYLEEKYEGEFDKPLKYELEVAMHLAKSIREDLWFYAPLHGMAAYPDFLSKDPSTIYAPWGDALDFLPKNEIESGYKKHCNVHVPLLNEQPRFKIIARDDEGTSFDIRYDHHARKCKPTPSSSTLLAHVKFEKLPPQTLDKLRLPINIKDLLSHLLGMLDVKKQKEKYTSHVNTVPDSKGISHKGRMTITMDDKVYTKRTDKLKRGFRKIFSKEKVSASSRERAEEGLKNLYRLIEKEKDAHLKKGEVPLEKCLVQTRKRKAACFRTLPAEGGKPERHYLF